MNSITGYVKSKFRSLLSPACKIKKIYNAETSTDNNNKKASKSIEFHSISHKGNENLAGKYSKLKYKPKRKFNSTDTAKKNNVGTNLTARKNDLNIQMLSESLYQQIFGKNSQNEVDKLVIEKAKFELKKHGLWKEKVDLLKEVSLRLPLLKGENIEEHFWKIGKEQSEPYKDLLISFSKNGIPKPPEKWLCQEGWTKYVNGQKPVAVPFPSDDALVFDVEVCIKLGDLPTLATAVSSTAWYGWVCSHLADWVDPVPIKFIRSDMLIPFEGKNINKKQPRIIIGHNVSYDRARIKEQYYIKNSSVRFLDTMSLHNCIGGVSTKQKAKFKKKPEEIELDALQSLSCLSSLKEVYLLYCNQTLDKDQRNIFVTGNISDVRNDFQNVMTYCANDVKATYEVFKVIFPVFLERFPHPVTLAGMLEMSTAFLPVNSNWNKFLAEAEQTYDDLNNEIMSLLAKKSDYVCKLFHEEKYKDDLWLWDEDWSTQMLKLNQKKRKQKLFEENSTSLEEHELDEIEKKLDLKFHYLFDMKDVLPLNLPFLPGYPLWYRNLLDKPNSTNLENWTPCPKLSTSKIITPKLLRLTWENFPLHYTRSFGWGILVSDVFVENFETNIPFKKLKELTLKNCNVDVNMLDAENVKNSKMLQRKNDFKSKVPYYQGAGIWCDHIVDNCCYFFKLPHSQGDLRNVGNPLSREFSHIFFGNFLSSSDAVFEKVVDLENKISYWRNNKERILGQMVVWLNSKKKESLNSENEQLLGVIIPKVVVCGTITRRAMEPTWLTASKVTKNRIGSELRSMVQAPPGYHIIGADVDSQELWIASLIGDSHFAKTHGSTPIGWMTLSGTKSKGTDMHSVTAKAVGISRDHAKIINYARIYGAGVNYAKKLLQNFNPAMKDEEAYSKAKKMYSFTKGKKVYKVKESMLEKFYETFGQSVDVSDVKTAMKLARLCNEKPENLFEKCHWINGTESAMFNQLEEIANSVEPRTPFLNCRLSQALEPKHNNDFFSITRINWVVQSGAVDFLHLMLVCMRWLTNGKARYCFSFHDEVRYLLPSEKRYNGALAMHITNLLVRAFCAYKVGIHDLPQSVAFFSSVEIDKTLRKEAYDDCVTPSNPHGLKKNYGIALGESVNIYDAIEKSKGSLAPFNSAKTRNVSSNKEKACLQRNPPRRTRITKRKPADC